MADKTEEGLNKIVNKAKKVFIKDEIITENNINNNSDCSLKGNNEDHFSTSSSTNGSNENTEKNDDLNKEVKNKEIKDLSDKKGEEK